jgi:hypothetical protein
VKEAEILLKAKLSEFSFVASSRQELSDVMILSALEVAGLTEMQIPRAVGQPAQVIKKTDGGAGVIRIANTGSGTVNLDPIPLDADNSISLNASTPQQYRIRLQGTKMPLHVSVQGVVTISLQDSLTQTRDFGPPKLLLLK